jgi:hypothetical protein
VVRRSSSAQQRVLQAGAAVPRRCCHARHARPVCGRLHTRRAHHPTSHARQAATSRTATPSSRASCSPRWAATPRRPSSATSRPRRATWRRATARCALRAAPSASSTTPS